MDIPRIDASLLRILSTTDAAAAPVRLALGERVMAQVTGHLADGRLLLDVKGQTLEARSALPLSAGQSVQLEVAGLGQEIALRMLGSTAVLSEQRLALGTLAVAHASTPSAPPPDVGALLKALDVEVSTLTSEQRGELSRLLGPLRVDAGPSALAIDLRNVLENGGLLFESRLRTWLESAAAAAAPQGLPAKLSSDLKVLLGLLGRALQALPSAQGHEAGAEAVHVDGGFATLLGRALNAAVTPDPVASPASLGAAAVQPGRSPDVSPPATQPAPPAATPGTGSTSPIVEPRAGARAETLPAPALLRAALEVEISKLPVAQRAEVTRALGVPVESAKPPQLAAVLDTLVRSSPEEVAARLGPWLGDLSAQPSVLLASSQALVAATRTPDLPPELKTLFALLGRALAGSSEPASPAPASPSPAPQAPTTAADGRAVASAAVPTGPPAPAVRGAGDERAVVDTLQRRAIDVVSRELEAARHNDRPALDTLRAEHAHVRDELLSRQIETAYHWVRDGTLSQQLPLLFGDQVAQAWLRFHRGDPEMDREAGSRTAPGVYSFDLALNPPGLGPLRAHVAWSGSHLRVRFYVAEPPAAAVITPALPHLGAALALTGFSKVDADVVVDASRSRLESLAPMTPPEGGTILNLRA